LTDYAEAVRLEPVKASYRAERGRCRRLAKDYDGSLADYAEAIRLDPKSADHLNGRGLTHQAKGDYAAAVADFTRAIDLKPDADAGWDNRGSAHARLGQWRRAADDFLVAWSVHKGMESVAPGGAARALKDATLWNRQAVARRAAGDADGYRRTCADMLTWLGANPGVLAWTGKGAPATAVLRMVRTCAAAPKAVGDTAALVQWAERARAADPGNDSAVGTLGAALYRDSRFEEVVCVLTDSVEGPSKRPAVREWLFLALAHQALGHTADACRCLDAARTNGKAETAWDDDWEIERLREEAEAALRPSDKPRP
jgi:uncharacterized protein HemY